jgi:hypothetical protein
VLFTFFCFFKKAGSSIGDISIPSLVGILWSHYGHSALLISILIISLMKLIIYCVVVYGIDRFLKPKPKPKPKPKSNLLSDKVELQPLQDENEIEIEYSQTNEKQPTNNQQQHIDSETAALTEPKTQTTTHENSNNN